jgi:hypothetical protein
VAGSHQFTAILDHDEVQDGEETQLILSIDLAMFLAFTGID